VRRSNRYSGVCVIFRLAQRKAKVVVAAISLQSPSSHFSHLRSLSKRRRFALPIPIFFYTLSNHGHTQDSLLQSCHLPRLPLQCHQLYKHQVHFPHYYCCYFVVFGFCNFEIGIRSFVYVLISEI